METIAHQAEVGGWLVPGAYVAIAATTISGAALFLLHGMSPELAPSWRMVSEYANGKYAWVLTVVFVAWALGSFAAAAALWPLSASTLGKIGLLFLILAGIGQTMGGLFDINHPLHGTAAMIGIPSLCLAAVLLTMAMSRHGGIEAPPSWSAHLPWVSFALMLGTFGLFFSSLKAAGVDMSGQTPLAQLPDGVVGYVGWANRLLFVATYVWVALACLSVVKTAR